MEQEKTGTVIDSGFILSKPPTFVHRVDLLEKYEKLLVEPTNILFTGVTGSGKTMCVKSNIEHRLIRNPDMIALVLDYKNESAFWEKQNDLKMVEELEKWGERPAMMKTMLVIPFLATKMTENVLKDGWHYDNRAFVKYVTLNQMSLDYKDYSLLSRINVGKMETIAVNFIEEFIEILKIRGRPINAETLLEIAYQKMKSPRDRLRIKRELKKISTIGFIGHEGSEHNFNLYKLLKFAIENKIRIIQFAMGDLSEDLQPVRSVFARKIIEEALSIKRKNRITNRLLVATMELQEYTKKFGSGFYASEYLLSGVFDSLFRIARQIGIQTLSDSQIPSRLPDTVWSNCKTVVCMKLDDSEEIFFVVKRRIDSDTFVRNNPPRVRNIFNDTYMFDKFRGSVTIDNLVTRMPAGYGVIIVDRIPYFLSESSMMPCRTFHRKIGSLIFPHIDRCSREEIINKIGMEQTDFSSWIVFDDEREIFEEGIATVRKEHINTLKNVMKKLLGENWGKRTHELIEAAKELYSNKYTQEEIGEVLGFSQPTISNILRS